MMRLGIPDEIRACLFDLDGVLTKTAVVHAAAWKQMFDDFLRRRDGERFRPFDAVDDYDAYVDGRPRFDGVRTFLAARGIVLPEGEPGDPPERDTVHGLGNRKNLLVLEKIRKGGVQAYPGSVRLVVAARGARLATAVVSSSANCQAVLAAAGIERLFDTRIDGVVAAERGSRANRTPTPSSRRRATWASHLPARRSSRTRRPEWRPAGRADSATSSGSTGPIRRTRCARTARTSW